MEHILDTQFDNLDKFLSEKNYAIIATDLDLNDHDKLTKEDILKGNFHADVKFDSIEAADFVEKLLKDQKFSVRKKGFINKRCYAIPYKAILQLNWNQRPPEKF